MGGLDLLIPACRVRFATTQVILRNETKQPSELLIGPEHIRVVKVAQRPITNWLKLQMVGGRDRDRTGDPLLAKQVLSQLSYTPT